MNFPARCGLEPTRRRDAGGRRAALLAWAARRAARLARLGHPVALVLCIIATGATASPPAPPAANQRITLDGTPLGSAIANRSAVPTILYDSATATWHMWVEVADETGDTAADFVPLRIGGFRHATSANGASFTTTATLSFSGNPFASTVYGAVFGEPAWIYPRAALWNGRYTLMLWTFNDYFSGAPSSVFGDYNYNISVNDAGLDPANAALTHLGPVGPVPANGIAGQTAAPFGIVNGAMYYDNNSLLGRAVLVDSGPQAFPAAASSGPWQVTASNAAVADPLTPLGFVACQFSGGDTYVHNSARVVDNGDGTLGWFFSLRNCDGSRKGQQIYYMESADNGLSWSPPVGLFAPSTTIGGNALTGGFSLADVVVRNGERVVYFNAQDADGNLVVGAAPPAPAPVIAALPVPATHDGVIALLCAALALLAGLRLARTRGA